MTKTLQNLARLLLKVFRKLKLAIIFKIFLLFYLLLTLTILSKKIYIFKNLYTILLLSHASYAHNTNSNNLSINTISKILYKIYF